MEILNFIEEIISKMEFDYSIIKFPCSIAFFFYNVLSVQENEITQEFANKLTFTSEFEKFAQKSEIEQYIKIQETKRLIEIRKIKILNSKIIDRKIIAVFYKKKSPEWIENIPF